MLVGPGYRLSLMGAFTRTPGGGAASLCANRAD